MTEIALIFWTVVFLAGVVAFLIRDVHDDDPTRSSGVQPPRSHHDDPFSHTGASFH